MSRTGRDCLVTVVDSELIVDDDEDACCGNEDGDYGQRRRRRKRTRGTKRAQTHARFVDASDILTLCRGYAEALNSRRVVLYSAVEVSWMGQCSTWGLKLRFERTLILSTSQ